MTRADARNALLRVAHQIDITTIRSILAVCSLVWAIAMLAGPQTFHRNGWMILAHVSNEFIWGCIFLLHFLTTLWRFVDPQSRFYWNQIVNIYGFLIWFFVTLATNITLGAFSPGSAAEWVLIACQGYVILRTGYKKEVVTL